MPYDSTYRRYLKVVQFIETEGRMAITGKWREEDKEGCF
jgi:hypothetical protein